MRAIGVVIALAAALALQTTLAGLTIHGATAVNLVLIAVIYVALAFGPVAGLMAGTVGGLVQDALAGGIVGVGGFSKTLVGFLVGLLGAQFIVAQSLPRFVMFVTGTIVHELCYQALFALVERLRARYAPAPPTWLIDVSARTGIPLHDPRHHRL